MTSCRVPRCSDRIETTPYATRGATAASARRRAKRTEMWRMKRRMSVGAHDLLCGRRPPETDAVQDVPAFFGRGHVKTPADGARTFAPGQEQRRRLILSRPLKRIYTLSILVLRFRMANLVEGGINRCARYGLWNGGR